jgi:hypothetical protein
LAESGFLGFEDLQDFFWSIAKYTEEQRVIAANNKDSETKNLLKKLFDFKS